MGLERQAPGAPIRVLVVDDHPAVREGLAFLASSEGRFVAAQASGRVEALSQVERQRPDVAIVDLSLDGEDGLPLVTDLKLRRIPVLVYSMHGDARHVHDAFVRGASGYVTKSEFRGVLVDAIRAVAAGRRFVSPRAAVALTESLAGGDGTALSTLSTKERQVYRMLGEGEGTYEIAAAMHISTHTVESYYSRIQQKLGLDGMYRLRRHAIHQVQNEGV